MNLFFLRDCLSRIFERKKTLIAFAAVFLLGMILGMCFVKQISVYQYHINLCARYVDWVCYSDTSVFLIFLARTAGHAILLLLVLAAGVHPATLLLTVVVTVFRAYTFGASLVVFFDVYGISGALIVFVLYLPVHLLIDAVLLFGCALSFGRARHFCFSKQDFWNIFCDFLTLLIVIAVVCLVEMILLLALFHPIGNIL